MKQNIFILTSHAIFLYKAISLHIAKPSTNVRDNKEDLNNIARKNIYSI